MTNDFPLLNANAIILLQERPENEELLFGFTVSAPGGPRGFVVGSARLSPENGENAYEMWTRGFGAVPELQQRIISLTMPVHRSEDILDDTASERLLKKGATWENLFLAAKSCERWSDILYGSTSTAMTSMDRLIFSSVKDTDEKSTILRILLSTPLDVLVDNTSSVVAYIDNRCDHDDNSFARRRESTQHRIIESINSSRDVLTSLPH